MSAMVVSGGMSPRGANVRHSVGQRSLLLWSLTRQEAVDYRGGNTQRMQPERARVDDVIDSVTGIDDHPLPTHSRPPSIHSWSAPLKIDARRRHYRRPRVYIVVPVFPNSLAA